MSRSLRLVVDHLSRGALPVTYCSIPERNAHCATGLDLARLQWRRWSIGDLVMSRCRVDNLVVSGYVRPRTHRAAWTNLSCGECRFVIAAVPGHHDRVDLNHFQADDAIVVVVNLTRTDDHRPRCFSLVTSPKRNHMRDCTSADD